MQLNKGASSSSESSSLVKPKDEVKLPSSSTGKLLVSSTQSVAPVATSSAFTLPPAAAASVMPPASGIGALAGLTSIPNFEAVKRAQELAAKMGFRQDPEFAPLINMFPGHISTDVAVQQKPAKAPVLRLDALGREIDEHGNVINMPKLNNLSTLKVCFFFFFFFKYLFSSVIIVSIILLILIIIEIHFTWMIWVGR